MKADFSTDLGRGLDGELRFLKRYSHVLTKTDGRKGDFRIISNGDLVELKTEFYSAVRRIQGYTDNFFIERYSREGVDGGPWQALSGGSKWYFHLYVNCNSLFGTNDIPQLISKVEHLVKQYDLSLVPIKNLSYVTEGYLIKRKWIADIMKDFSRSYKRSGW